MKKLRFIILSILSFCIYFSVFANSELDSLEQKPTNTIIPFVSLMVEQIHGENRTIVQKGFSAGITINNRVNLGVFSAWSTDDFSFEKTGLLRQFKMKYIHGGVLTSYNLRISKSSTLNLGTRVGQGSVRLLNTNSETGIVKQSVYIMHPDVGFEISPFSQVKLKFNVGYRLMSDLKLQELVKGDLAGFSYGMSVKIDLFKKNF
ncbi:hypothetical protein [Reichenbachiella sp. MALMAid0571]|uniref:hypothetical protein n=1 Tax=Reichenbachiella sp. MALMAid0571 TaxID=3143939 RepID=UPI0032DE78CF